MLKKLFIEIKYMGIERFLFKQCFSILGTPSELHAKIRVIRHKYF